MTDFYTYAIIAILSTLVFIIAGRYKSRFGINLKRVYCPVCHTKQPIIRMPGSMDQAFWGGTICPKCHTKLDKYGDIIP